MRAMLLRRQGPISLWIPRPGRASDPEPRAGRGSRARAGGRRDLPHRSPHHRRRSPVSAAASRAGSPDSRSGGPRGPGRRPVSRRGSRRDRAGFRWTCGTCELCRTGAENLCEASRYTGYHEDGGYAELTVVPEAFAYPIPAAFSDTDAAPCSARASSGIVLSAGPSWRAAGASDSTASILRPRGHPDRAPPAERRSSSRHGRPAIASCAAARRRLGRGRAPSRSRPRSTRRSSSAPAGAIVPPALRAVRKGGVVVLAGIHMTPIPTHGVLDRTCLHEKTLRSVEANTPVMGRSCLREAAGIPIRPSVTPISPRGGQRGARRAEGRPAGRHGRAGARGRLISRRPPVAPRGRVSRRV